jgi:uncharacterized lipoprotein YajG
MIKPLALTAALLLLAGCNASNPTAPTTNATPSFSHTTTGCPIASAALGTAGEAGRTGLELGCSSGN